MSYRIRPGQLLTGEVVRIAEIQYERAIHVLRRQPDGPYQAIHDARKRFKRLRGLFRLVRAAAPDFFARENARLRDMAATLSEVRDATALVEHSTICSPRARQARTGRISRQSAHAWPRAATGLPQMQLTLTPGSPRPSPSARTA